MIYREATPNDLSQLMELGVVAYGQFADQLTKENWALMHQSLTAVSTYEVLFATGTCFLSETDDHRITGMAWLIKSGHPTEIYPENWSYIRFVAVHPDFGGKGIGRELTKRCMEAAQEAGEHTIALHTSEIMNAARHIYENLGFEKVREIGVRYGIRYFLYRRLL